jgi:hypothetical protein
MKKWLDHFPGARQLRGIQMAVYEPKANAMSIKEKAALIFIRTSAEFTRMGISSDGAMDVIRCFSLPLVNGRTRLCPLPDPKVVLLYYFTD